MSQVAEGIFSRLTALQMFLVSVASATWDQSESNSSKTLYVADTHIKGFLSNYSQAIKTLREDVNPQKKKYAPNKHLRIAKSDSR